MGRGFTPSLPFPVALSRRAVGDLQALGASCWLIFRSFLPLLASLGLSQCHFWHLLAPLSLSERIFVDFEKYSEPQNSPGTSKINEKPLVFLGFLLFPFFVQDDRKASKNDPRKPPRLPQTPSQILPKHSKMAPTRPKMAPRRLLALQDAPKARPRCAQDAPRLPKTRQDYPKKPPRPLQNSIFEGLGKVLGGFWDDFSKIL